MTKKKDEWIPLDVEGGFSFDDPNRLMLGVIPNLTNTDICIVMNIDIVEQWLKYIWGMKLDDLMDEIFHEEFE